MYDNGYRMWCIFQNVVVPRLFSRHDLFRLPSNAYHGIAKPFESQTSALKELAEVMEASPIDLF
jgi:hypothetical protein